MAEDLPKRMFLAGDRKLVSFRLPEELIKALKEFAKREGWSDTDVVQTALDLYLQKKVSTKRKS